MQIVRKKLVVWKIGILAAKDYLSDKKENFWLSQEAPLLVQKFPLEEKQAKYHQQHLIIVRKDRYKYNCRGG